MKRKFFSEFLKLESASGLLLCIASVVALGIANFGLAEQYFNFLNIPVAFTLGSFEIKKTILLFVNDGLMALFFLLVALEMKREKVSGHLSSAEAIVLPGFAAVAGVAVPSAIFYFFNMADPIGTQGWAIPAATDIAFSLAVLGAFGKRVPFSLKVFLTAVAVVDDLIAIIVIALFYSSKISVSYLAIAALLLVVLVLLNKKGTENISIYLLIGFFLWLAVLKSGVHATLAGVLVGFCIPHKKPEGHDHTLLEDLEHTLHPWVAFAILPIFAFCNAGVNLSGTGPELFFGNVSLGIIFGLVLGKPIGVGLGSLILIKSGRARLPEGSNAMQLLGVSFLTGIGFTMSLFIGGLAFKDANPDYLTQTKIGVILASLIAAGLGSTLLSFSSRRAATRA